MRLPSLLVLGTVPLASALLPTIFDDDDFDYCYVYRGIASNTCSSRRSHGCDAMDYNECQQAFNELPAIHSYLDRTSDEFRSYGCLPDYAVGSSTLQYNSKTGTSASRGNPALCKCDDEISRREWRDDYDQERGAYENPTEWCNGWNGDITINPTEFFKDSHVPTRTALTLAGALGVRGMGIYFVPEVGLLSSRINSIGINMRFLSPGIHLRATLWHAKKVDCEAFIPGFLADCPMLITPRRKTNNQEANPVFRDRETTEGEGDASNINYVDFYDLKLNETYVYMLTFMFPGNVPTNNNPDEPFYKTRIWVYRPTTNDPEGFNYTHTNITYMSGVSGVTMPITTSGTTAPWARQNVIPEVHFKLCARHRVDNECAGRPCTFSRFWTFRCDWWVYLLTFSLLTLAIILCCLFCGCGFCGGSGGGGGLCGCGGGLCGCLGCGVGGCCPGSGGPTEELCVCLNFIDFDTGERWYRKGVRLNTPIKLLAYEVAELLDKPRSTTTLWLRRTGKRMQSCYTVQDYRIDANDDIFVVQRGCSNMCGCCSIEDIFCCCFARPAFDQVNVEDERAKLIKPNRPPPRPPLGGQQPGPFGSPVPGSVNPSSLPSAAGGPLPSAANSVQMSVVRPGQMSQRGTFTSRVEGQMRGSKI